MLKESFDRPAFDWTLPVSPMTPKTGTMVVEQSTTNSDQFNLLESTAMQLNHDISELSIQNTNCSGDSEQRQDCVSPTSALLRCEETFDNDDDCQLSPSCSSPTLICMETLDDDDRDQEEQIARPTIKRKLGDEPSDTRTIPSHRIPSDTPMDDATPLEILSAFEQFMYNASLKMHQTFKSKGLDSQKTTDDSTRDLAQSKYAWWQCLPEVTSPLAVNVLVEEEQQPHHWKMEAMKQEEEAKAKLAHRQRIATFYRQRASTTTPPPPPSSSSPPPQPHGDAKTEKTAVQTSVTPAITPIEAPLRHRFHATHIMNQLRDRLSAMTFDMHSNESPTAPWSMHEIESWWKSGSGTAFRRQRREGQWMGKSPGWGFGVY